MNNQKQVMKQDKDGASKQGSVVGGKANITVAVRCRPLTPKEMDTSTIETIRVLKNNNICVLDQGDERDTFKHRSKEQQYAFDFAFDKTSTQQDVYEASCKFLLSGIVEGYNATVFAYGATGAGKTHTMLGTGTDPGIMARSLADLFTLVEEASNREFKLKLIYVEIYNENLRDLLGNGDNLDLREDPVKGTVISGVNEMEVSTTTEVFSLLLKGNKNRVTESTNMNETSSRSHAVLQITLENKKKNVNEISMGKFLLVDLAGSERASHSLNTGQRLVEGASINKSLLALGNCINTLVDISNGSNKTFIPWRDSKLTRILKDSLGGNSRIVMIANISPSIFSIDETINTLKYANRAKNIKTTIKRNAVEVDYHIGKYDEIITNLKKEVDNLRHELAIKTHNQQILKTAQIKDSPLSKIEKASRDIAQHFQHEIKLQKEINEEENKINSIRTNQKEKEYELYSLTNQHGSNLKQKELRNIVLKYDDTISIHQNLLDAKISTLNDLKGKRNELEQMIDKLNQEPLGSSLTYTYQYYLMLMSQLTNEHIKSLNQNEYKLKENKLNLLVEQLKIRDEHIKTLKAEFKKKKIKLSENDNIKSLDELDINQSVKLPSMVYNNEASLEQVNLAKSISKFDRKNRLNYQAYNNPNVIRTKTKFKSKVTEIMDKARRNQLTNLQLNVINSNYPNSKIHYVNSPNNKRMNESQQDGNIIAFDARLLGRSLTPSRNNISLTSHRSTEISNSSINIRERELENKYKKLLVKKRRVGPYVN